MSDYLDSLTAETAMPMDTVPILRYPYSTDSPTPAQIAELMAEMGIDLPEAMEFNVNDVSTAVASFLEYGNGVEASHIEPSTITAQLPDRTARIRQQHSAYAFDTVMESPLVFVGVEKKSEYEMAKYEPVVFESIGEVKSAYCWPESDGKKSLSKSSSEAAANEGNHWFHVDPPANVISARNVTSAALSSGPEAQPHIHWEPSPIVNPDRLYALLLSYQQQTNSPYNDVVTGLGRT